MKKWIWVFIAAALLSGLCAITNTFIIALPDWLVRTSGIVALVSIAVIAYGTARILIGRSKQA